MFRQLVGQTLDRYQLISLLGESELGAMFKATDPTLQRAVAIKAFDLQLTSNPEAGEHVLQRAREAARLDHSGLIRVHDFGRSQSLLYIVMEFLAGGSLRQLLLDLRAANQWLPLSEAVELVRQLALVLDHVSRQGQAPRSVHPKDIMFKAEPSGGLPLRPILADLGLEDVLRKDWQSPAEGAARPVYAYWSPEQAAGQPLDACGQVYALGVLLYELSVGWQPFPVNTLAEAVRAHTSLQPPPPRARRADLPAELEAIILQALSKDPTQRQADPAALAAALQEVLPAAQAIPAGNWEVSLRAAYERSLNAADTAAQPAVVPAPAAPAAPVTQRAAATDLGRIRIVSPNGQTRHAPLRAGGVTIGRVPGNDIVLDDAAVSSRHARVDIEAGAVKIVDLNSQNGVFIGGARLVAGAPEAWPAGTPVLVGDTWLHLEMSAARPKTYRFDGVTVDAALIQSSPNGNVGVYVEASQMTVTPGQPAAVGIVVVNQGQVADRYNLSVAGLPPNWTAEPAPPASVALAPGAHQRIKITVQPPRSPQTRAGRVGLVLRAASQNVPDQSVEGKVTLTVAAFSHFTSELNPPAVAVNVPARVSVYNQGNTQETYTIAFEDPHDELVFNPPAISLSVPEGQVGPADFSVALQRPRLIGGRLEHRFGVRIITTHGESQRHEAQLVSSALVPVWLPVFMLVVACLLASIAGVVIADNNRRAASSTATAQHNVVALTGTALAATAGTAVADVTRTPTPDTPTPTATETFLPGTPSETPAPTGTPAPTDTLTPVVVVVTATPEPPTATLTPEPPTATLTPTLTPPPAPPASAGLVVFESRRDGNPEIYLMNANGDSQARLTNTTTGGGNSIAAAWSPAAGRIAFQTNRDGPWEIYVMNPDGSGQTRLTVDPGSDTEPAWSPNGAQIAFVSTRDGNPEIYVMNANGTGQTRLMDHPAGDFRPVWSPDGSRIAFESERDGNREIYVMNADGSGLTRLTTHPASDTHASWSPSGALIAFVSDRDTNSEIYVMNPDGSGQNRLTNAPGPDSQPAWSPNGALIAFVSQRDGNPELYVMQADGLLQRRLTDHPSPDEFPVWSPDSSSLMFASQRDGNSELYALNIAGGAPVRLTNNATYDAPIFWRP